MFVRSVALGLRLVTAESASKVGELSRV